MAIDVQYSKPLADIIAARSSGARAPFAPGDLRGRVRGCSAMARIANAVDMSENDIVGFFELEPGIRLLSLDVKMSPLHAEDADFDLVAYNPDAPTDATKVVTLVPDILANRTGIEAGTDSAPTADEVADAIARQFPLHAGRDVNGSDDIFWSPKLVQLDPTAYAWDLNSAWATTTAYVRGERVSNSGSYYKCAVAHTSGTFATDLAAGYWVLQGTDYDYLQGDYVIDSNEYYKCNTSHVSDTSFATGYAAGYWTQEFGIIDISDACPVPDGVSGVNPGSFGVGLQGTGGTDIPADTMIQLNLTYLHE